MTSLALPKTLDCDRAAELDRLRMKLRTIVHGRVGNFQLIDNGAGLILRGTTSSFYQKQLAQHAVMKATDIPIAANEIEVA